MVDDLTDEQVLDLQHHFQTDWRSFYRDVLAGPELWAKQSLMWDSVMAHQRTLVISAHATGKDFLSGRIVPWFLSNWIPSIVITTAPSDRQVNKVVWGEIRSAVKNAKVPLGGRMLEQEWKFAEKHYAIGFATKDSQTVSNRFQGFHERNVLILLSEASGLHPSIWESLEGLTTGDYVRVLAISQPPAGSGPFYEMVRTACRKGVSCRCLDWHLIEISAWEAAEANAQRQIPGLATLEWCQERLRKWGEQSPFYQLRVLGRVPDASEDVVIPLAWATRATELELSDEGAGGIGVDVAWKGGDESVITVVRGKRQARHVAIHGQDTLEVTGRTLQVAREEQIKTVAVDVGGVGAGVYDQLMDASGALGLSVIAVNFGGKPNNDDDYVDKGAEMWWELREDLRLGLFQLLNDDEQIAQMTSRKYSTPKGKIKLESKEELRKRGVQSPDRVDGLLLARQAQQYTGGGLGLRILRVNAPDDAVWRPVG